MSRDSSIINIKTLQFFLIMTVIGFIGNLRGVLLPSIRSDLGITYSDVGLMIFMSSIGYMSSNLLGGIAGDRFGQRKVIMFGFAILPVGIISLYYTRSFAALVLSMTLVSIGLGSFDIGLNSLASRIFVVNTALMMNTMHFFYGVGSSVSPKFASWLLVKALPWHTIYVFSLAVVAIAFIPFLLNPVSVAHTTHTEQKLPLSILLKDIRLWLFIGVLGFSEAAEVGISSWMVNFLQAGRGMSQSVSAQYMFYFFIIFTIGRILGGHIVERLGYVKTIFICASIVIVLLTGGLTLGNEWTILFSLAGFFISVMFPTIIAIISKVFPGNSSSIIGVVLTFAGMIGMLTSWLIGRLNDSFGVLVGFASIPVYEAIFIVLLLIARKYVKADGNTVPENETERVA